MILLDNHLPLSEQPTTTHSICLCWCNYHVDNLAYNGVWRVPEGALYQCGLYKVQVVMQLSLSGRYYTCTVCSYKRVNMMIHIIG